MKNAIITSIMVATILIAGCGKKSSSSSTALPPVDLGQYSLRTPGRFQMNDATNQVTVTVTDSGDKKLLLSLSWRANDVAATTATRSLVRDGWFVFAEDVSHIWVFDGGTLWLSSNTDKSQADTFIPESEVDKRCPKKVRDALPERYHKKHVP